MEEKDLLKRVEILEKQQRSLLDAFSPIWHDYHKNGGLGYAVKSILGILVLILVCLFLLVAVLHAKNIC